MPRLSAGALCHFVGKGKVNRKLSQEIARYDAELLFDFGKRLLQAMGANAEEAWLVSDALLHGSLHGHPGQGQGYNKLPRMWQRVQASTIRPGAHTEQVTSGPGWAMIDAQGAFGIVAAARAMDQAIVLAEEVGVGSVFVRGSNHLGASGYHALRAANREMIGLCMTNAGAEMAPWGGITPVLGTNPWGIAVPSTGEFPLLLDIALTQSGKGMVRWNQQAGLPIPKNWAYAPDGSETDDPELAMKGPLVPMGEHKGVGLSFMTDVLTGVLTGAAYGKDTYADPAYQNVGHFMMAIDPDRFVGREAFYRRLEDLCAQVKSSETKAGVEEVFLPGELDYRNRTERLRNGVPVTGEMREDLLALAEELEVHCPW